MIIFSFTLQLVGLAAITMALPSSILEDIKDTKMHSPVRANKVKRAQEFIMFGNQQNRASNFGRNEKRSSVLDDNSINEDMPMPNVANSPMEEQGGYESNQLGSGKEYDRGIPNQLSREIYYNLLLRNLELQALQNDPSYNMELPSYYNNIDSRSKREIRRKKSQTKPHYRQKRDYQLSTEELLSLMKLWEIEKASQRGNEQRNHMRWSPYEQDPEFGDDEENMVDLSEDNDLWYNSPVYIPPQHSNRETVWAKPKRFMNEPGIGDKLKMDENSEHQRFILK